MRITPDVTRERVVYAARWGIVLVVLTISNAVLFVFTHDLLPFAFDVFVVLQCVVTAWRAYYYLRQVWHGFRVGGYRPWGG